VDSDLRDALGVLERLVPNMSGAIGEEDLQALWRCYLSVEKSILFIKLELDDEGVGRFVNKKAYSVPDDRQAVAFAAASLRTGLASLGRGDLPGSLKPLRESRSYMRMLLRRKSLASRRQLAADHD
jgi:hypothetical protein